MEQKLEEEEDLVDQGGEENIHFSCLKKKSFIHIYPIPSKWGSGVK